MPDSLATWAAYVLPSSGTGTHVFIRYASTVSVRACIATLKARSWIALPWFTVTPLPLAVTVTRATLQCGTNSAYLQGVNSNNEDVHSSRVGLNLDMTGKLPVLRDWLDVHLPLLDHMSSSAFYRVGPPQPRPRPTALGGARGPCRGVYGPRRGPTRAAAGGRTGPR